VRNSSRVGYYLAQKYYTRVEVTDRDKRTRLLGSDINTSRVGKREMSGKNGNNITFKKRTFRG